jgi:hypothetical protein
VPDLIYWVEESYFYVTIAVVADFDEVATSCGYSGVYIGHPLDVFVQVIGCYLIFRVIRAVNIRIQEHIVN